MAERLATGVIPIRSRRAFLKGRSALLGSALWLAAWGVLAPLRAGVTLTSSVAEVVVEDLRVGKKYSLAAAQRAPLRIRYAGPSGVVLRVEPFLPAGDAIKPGYEPLPRLAWIRVRKNSFPVRESPARFETDVILRVPRRARYRGRHYQVNLRIFVEPVDGPKSSLSVALENRFLVSTRP